MKRQRPRNLRDLGSFLGMTNYYRNFVRNYAHLASPLYELMRDGVKFEWTDECEAAFQELRSRLVSAPILRMPDMNKPYILHCDASNESVGICSRVQIKILYVT